MGEKYLGQLTAKSAPATGDIMVLEDSEDTKKIDYDALANAILNKLTTKTYTVAGGTNTLIAAIDALNSKITNTFLKNIGDKTDADLNAMTTPGIYYTWISMGSKSPGKSQWCFLIVGIPSDGYCSQVLISAQTSIKIASRYMNNGTWSTWFTLS